MFEKIAKQQKCLLQEHHAGLLSPIGTILEDITHAVLLTFIACIITNRIKFLDCCTVPYKNITSFGFTVVLIIIWPVLCSKMLEAIAAAPVHL